MQLEPFNENSIRRFAISLGSKIEYIVSHPEEYPETVEAVEEEICSTLVRHRDFELATCDAALVEAGEGLKKTVKDLWPDADTKNPTPLLATQISYKDGYNKGIKDYQNLIKKV